MAHSIEAIDRGDYVYVKFFGDWPQGQGPQILGDIFAAIVTSGHWNALVDYREAGNMDSDTMMDFEEASFAAELPDIKKYKFAVLYRPSEVSRFLFWETVAVNRAIKMKSFKDEEAAVKWLTE